MKEFLNRMHYGLFCYLIALGLDDVEMMARAACLAPNSVKAYRKECLQVVGDENLSDRVETFC